VTFLSYFVCIHLKKQVANVPAFHKLHAGSAGLFPGPVETVLLPEKYLGFKGQPAMIPRTDFFNDNWLQAGRSGLARYGEFMV